MCTFILLFGLSGARAEISTSTNISAESGSGAVAPASDTFSAPKTLFGSKKSSSTAKFLPVNQAFVLSAIQVKDKVLVSVKVTPNYYVYQKRFSVQAGSGLTPGNISFDQKAEFEDDPEFGNVPVFHQDVNLSIPVQGNGQLTLNWQGCAKAGLCYPPEQFKFKVEPIASTVKPPIADSVQSSENKPSTEKTPAEKTSTEKMVTATDISSTKPATDKSSAVKITALGEAPPIMATALDDTITSAPLEPAQASSPTAVESSALTASSVVSDPFGLAEHPLIAFGLLFLAGLGLAFTPCVLPMLPIVANLVAKQHRQSAAHGFALSAAYAVGVASSYAVLGALIAVFGHQVNLITWSQQPALLIAFAIVFVLLALHSFELFHIRLPRFIASRIEKVGQVGQMTKWSGSITGCWVAGFFSALIVSPCLSAPLAGVLLSVSTVGNPWLGAAALFCLGLGLGVPLMILGATEGKLLPKAGDWLNWVRRGFGLLLLGVALVLLSRVFTASWMLLAWAALSVLFALWFWVWRGRGRLLTKALSIFMGVWAILQVVGASIGANDPLRPLFPLVQQQIRHTEPQQVEVIYTLNQLTEYQKKYPRLLVDVTADWCISCKIIERELFQKNPVPELQTWTRIKLDVTKTTDDSRAVLQALNIFGPPALLLYKQGQLVEQVQGEPTREEFQGVLQKHR